jgi:hypothetical protein
VCTFLRGADHLLLIDGRQQVVANMEAEGPADFTGYWVLSRVEQLDEYARALGFPWALRRAALRFGTGAVDLVAHTGTAVKVTSLNAKGSWTRTYDTARAVDQRTADGAPAKTTAQWEGARAACRSRPAGAPPASPACNPAPFPPPPPPPPPRSPAGAVLHSRLEGSPLGVCESWRYRRGDVMVVRSSVRLPRGGEAACCWFFERMEALERHVGGGSRAALLRALAADQRRVHHATRRDTQGLLKVVLDCGRWASPADDFIRVVSPSSGAPLGRGSPSPSHPARGARPGGSPPPAPRSASSASLASEAARSRLGNGASAAPEAFQEWSVLPRDAAGAPLPPLAPRPEAPAAAAAAAAPAVTFPMLSRNDTARMMAPPGEAPPAAQPAHRRQRSGESLGRRAAHYRSPSADSTPQFTPASPTPAQRGPPTGGEALMVYKMEEFVDGR